MLGQFRSTVLLLAAGTLAASQWLQWRGPNENGTAPGDAPLEWSDTKNVAWKAAIPGRGFSSPIVSGDRIFLTTAIPTRTVPKNEASATGLPAEQRPGWGGGAGTGSEYKFQVIALDRHTGKTAWERTAAATPGLDDSTAPRPTPGSRLHPRRLPLFKLGMP